jgi:UDP-N-acetylmuramate dehydrogenase
MPLVRDARLRDYAYYKTGGTCDELYEPASVDELAAIVRDVTKRGLPLMLLGGGTNSLVSDEHFSGAVVAFRSLAQLDVQGGRLVCGAGVDNSDIARAALKHGLDGAGWMYRLPGQLGGTVRMNARCYGGEISQITVAVTVVTRQGEIKVHRDKSVFRGYKDTSFMETGELIAGAELVLREGGDRAAIEAKMLACERDRESRQQFTFPSCGCVFKNDYRIGVSSGILLDAAGAKAMRQGGAEVSPGHANFVFNKGATSRDILELSFRMREAVYARFGAWLEYEMEILGTIPADLRARADEVRPQKLDDAALAPLRQRMVGITGRA